MFLSGASLTSPALVLVSEPTGISPSRSPPGSAPGSTHPGYGEIVPLYPGSPGTSSLYSPGYPGLEHPPFKSFLFIRSLLLQDLDQIGINFYQTAGNVTTSNISLISIFCLRVSKW